MEVLFVLMDSILKIGSRPSEPIWLMGRVYAGQTSTADDLAQLSPPVDPSEAPISPSVPEYSEFLSDFQSRPYFSYRADFPRIPNSPFTCDAGWGCTHRSGQMLLAQALFVHYLGRGRPVRCQTSQLKGWRDRMAVDEPRRRAQFAAEIL